MSDEPLDARVASWLRSQGYPLEMLTAQAFRAAGFGVAQAEFYRDASTGESREIDVIASRWVRIEKSIVECAIVIECKVSRDKPWVLFTSEAHVRPRAVTVLHRAVTQGGFMLLSDACVDAALYEHGLFRLPDRPGYGVTQAFGGPDNAHNACLSISQAAVGVVSAGDRIHYGMGITVVVQVVVLDGRLFEAFFDQTGNVAVREIPQGLLLWRNQVVGTGITLIHLVTAPALSAFAPDAWRAIDAFLSVASRLGTTLDKILGSKPPLASLG
jgi:hypothetical protein